MCAFYCVGKRLGSMKSSRCNSQAFSICSTHSHTVTVYLALAGICLTGATCLTSCVLRLGLGLGLSWLGVAWGWQQVMVQVQSTSHKTQPVGQSCLAPLPV